MLAAGAQTSTFPPRALIASDPRADGAQRRVVLHEGKVIIDRQVEGVAMRLGLPWSAYRGVVLTLSGAPDAPRYTIRLDHADPDLSIVLEDTSDDCEIVADWRAFAAMLRLPRFLEREPGRLEAAECRLGAVATGPATIMRRRGAIALRRRPRFLTRRRMGERRLMTRVTCEQVLSAPR